MPISYPTNEKLAELRLEEKAELQKALQSPVSAQSADRRILVTGGAGFIGSALVWELNRRGCTNILV